MYNTPNQASKKAKLSTRKSKVYNLDIIKSAPKRAANRADQKPRWQNDEDCSIKKSMVP